jgi:hypothetical protein
VDRPFLILVLLNCHIEITQPVYFTELCRSGLVNFMIVFIVFVGYPLRGTRSSQDECYGECYGQFSIFDEFSPIGIHIPNKQIRVLRVVMAAQLRSCFQLLLRIIVPCPVPLVPPNPNPS